MKKPLMPWGIGPQRNGEKIYSFESGIQVAQMVDVPGDCISTWVPVSPGHIYEDKRYGLKFLNWACTDKPCMAAQRIIRARLGMI